MDTVKLHDTFTHRALLLARRRVLRSTQVTRTWSINPPLPYRDIDRRVQYQCESTSLSRDSASSVGSDSIKSRETKREAGSRRAWTGNPPASASTSTSTASFLQRCQRSTAELLRSARRSSILAVDVVISSSMLSPSFGRARKVVTAMHMEFSWDAVSKLSSTLIAFFSRLFILTGTRSSQYKLREFSAWLPVTQMGNLSRTKSSSCVPHLLRLACLSAFAPHTFAFADRFTSCLDFFMAVGVSMPKWLAAACISPLAMIVQLVNGYRSVALKALVISGILILFRFLRLNLPSVLTPGGTFSGSEPELVNHVYNRTLGFEKVFVIGLPERTDRRDAMLMAAITSDIELEWIDGVHGEDLAEKAIPGAGRDQEGVLSGGQLGCWGGHMKALRTIVERNISSALIMEDDQDWDLRLKEQLHDFALAAHVLLERPLPSADSKETSVTEIDFLNLPSTTLPRHSPYGEDWDLMWLGYCGMTFHVDDGEATPKVRVVQHNDQTVPAPQHLHNFYTDGNDGTDELGTEYPPHTRVTHYPYKGLCSTAYAISQAGARRALASMALREPTVQMDFLLRDFCSGGGDFKYHKCLTTRPPLFEHFRPRGLRSAESDISLHDEAGKRTLRENPRSNMIRWSVRMNWDVVGERLGEGEDRKPIDQYPDDMDRLPREEWT